MTETPSTPSSRAVWRNRARRWAFKLLNLVVLGLATGWAYHWAAPRLYRSDQVAGFWRGTLHGALMPVAAPSLLMGKNVPIFTEHNSGRGYKLGYIAGINLCGLLFFGLAFWPSKRPPPEGPSQTDGKGPR